MVGARAAKLARGRVPLSIKNLIAWTVALASVPFGLLLLIPPLLVALTGVPIVPLLVWMERLAVVHRDVEAPVARVVTMV
jgi:hypothetical protein